MLCWPLTAGAGTQAPKTFGVVSGTPVGSRSGSEFDDYDRWFQQEEPGENPLRSGGLDWNSWRGAAYEFDHGLKWDTKQSQVGSMRTFLTKKGANPGTSGVFEGQFVGQLK